MFMFYYLIIIQFQVESWFFDNSSKAIEDFIKTIFPFIILSQNDESFLLSLDLLFQVGLFFDLLIQNAFVFAIMFDDSSVFLNFPNFIDILVIKLFKQLFAN